MTMELSKLRNPFPANDIEWRIQQSGVKNNKTGAMVLAYVTNRAIMDRLDEICGPENWANNFKEAPNGGLLCGIGIKCGDEWVTKWDGADNTQVEAIKGGLSSAMKRAGSQWGIGRYLYKLDATFADITEKGKHRAQAKDKAGKVHYFKWATPQLPQWALPEGTPKKQDTKAPEKDDKAPTPFEVMLGKFANAKVKMREKAGDDSVYQTGLKGLSIDHANEIDKAHGLTIADGNKLLKEFWAYLHPEEKKAAPKKDATFPPED